MRNYSLDISDKAIEDIIINTAYIQDELNNKTAAQNFYKDIYMAIESLSSMPERNMTIQHNSLVDLNIRIQRMRNYNICYSIRDSKCVEIMRVLHMTQNWVSILRDNIATSSSILHEISSEYIVDIDEGGTIVKTSAEFRNNYNMISELCSDENNHVVITKNGKEDMVAMSVEKYEKMSSYIG